GSMLSSALAVNPSGHMLADRFELGQEIGRGGMGSIYKGIDHKQSDPDKAPGSRSCLSAMPQMTQ
ncbi:MAG: hypothetical protein IPL73_25220, partial [Candidatus Obscuribacter sp.]|nr:hypothetical protein [Candidatus Obscuribacter sp.]